MKLFYETIYLKLQLNLSIKRMEFMNLVLYKNPFYNSIEIHEFY